MTAPAEIAAPPSRRRILLLTAVALAVALLLFLGAILPAQFYRDPIGLGRLTGIDTLWAPAEIVAPTTPKAAGAAPASRSYPTPFRSDVVDIPLRSGDSAEGSEVEYKVRVKAGGSYVYSWSVPGIANPDEFYTEFHGQTVPAAGANDDAMTVVYYRKATGARDNGVVTVPFDGIHGWFFQNQSVKPVIVHLRLSGFYELIPDGQPGNEAGLHAKPVRLP